MQKPFDLTFAVGPTKISQDVANDAAYAFANNIAEVSHRGAEFTEISKHTLHGLRTFLNVPESYQIFFTSSATEGWEICAKNLVEKEAFAFVNGNFSGAFKNCLESWGKVCHTQEVAWGYANNFTGAIIPKRAELITLCHNETSTGVTCQMDDIAHLRTNNPNKLIAVDITSSVGCATYNMELADVWYGSVQKGLGLPSGLGFMVVSPEAMAKSKQHLKDHPQGFFNLTNMEKQMANGRYQTISTPNILAIYLLGQQLERLNTQGAHKVAEQTVKRAEKIYNFFDNHPTCRPFVKDSSARSPYSLCIEVGEEDLKNYKQKAHAQNIQLGGGYGPLKNHCMRVSNYPAITHEDLEQLFNIFR